MKAKGLKEKYLSFFKKRGHKRLPNVSLIPENDPTALFISAGMHPLVPYLLGESHPLGKRLVSNQRCLRTTDIENVGDSHHLTFFEMLGNWSLGDYWKEEAISWSWEFLTKELGLPKEKFHVSCFKGDKDAPKDEESAKIWKKLGVPLNQIHFFGKKENWWAPIGQTGPCGPDTEMFIDMGGKCREGKKDCDPSCSCGRFFEVWNDVFMEYNQVAPGKYKPLKQRNVDTGMGVERMISAIQGVDDIFQINAFKPIIEEIEKASNKKYEGENKKPMRVIADHLRAAIFLIADGVVPSKEDRGYVLRRLIREVIRQSNSLGVKEVFSVSLARVIIDNYREEYPNLIGNKNKFLRELKNEEQSLILADIRYAESKARREVEEYAKRIGLNLKKKQNLEEIEKELLVPYKGEDAGLFIKENPSISTASGIAGTIVFDQKTTHGRPAEDTNEILNKHLNIKQDVSAEAQAILNKLHKDVSRKSAVKKFKGGLADHSEAVTKLHTVTHLLHQALRDVLGKHVQQAGSNITAERLRFDFVHPEKLTEEQKKKVEGIINEKIKADLPVKMEMMSLEEAKKKGAQALFGEKYGEKVKVYSIGDYSCEVCGGPHVKSTGEIGGVKIVKEKAVGTGRRRLYAQLA